MSAKKTEQGIVQITANQYWVLGLGMDGKVYRWDRQKKEWVIHGIPSHNSNTARHRSAVNQFLDG